MPSRPMRKRRWARSSHRVSRSACGLVGKRGKTTPRRSVPTVQDRRGSVDLSLVAFARIPSEVPRLRKKVAASSEKRWSRFKVDI